jgi:hypothetical protein
VATHSEAKGYMHGRTATFVLIKGDCGVKISGCQEATYHLPSLKFCLFIYFLFFFIKKKKKKKKLKKKEVKGGRTAKFKIENYLLEIN